MSLTQPSAPEAQERALVTSTLQMSFFQPPATVTVNSTSLIYLEISNNLLGIKYRFLVMCTVLFITNIKPHRTSKLSTTDLLQSLVKVRLGIRFSTLTVHQKQGVRGIHRQTHTHTHALTCAHVHTSSLSPIT